MDEELKLIGALVAVSLGEGGPIPDGWIEEKGVRSLIPVELCGDPLIRKGVRGVTEPQRRAGVELQIGLGPGMAQEKVPNAARGGHGSAFPPHSPLVLESAPALGS